MFEKLIELKRTGLLIELVNNGLISPKVLQYLEIYMWVDAKQKTTNLKPKEIVLEAEISFGLSRATIYRAIKVIKSR